MKITKRLQATVPYAIIGALALLNGPGMARVVYKIVKKEIDKRDRAHAARALQEATFRTILTRLKNQGLVENPSRGMWQATKKALGMYHAVRKKDEAYRKFFNAYGKKRDTIIIFDVSEKKFRVRNYLRMELISLGYELLQKSVWIGGSPLPKEFIAYLTEADLLGAVHIFTIEKRGTVA